MQRTCFNFVYCSRFFLIKLQRLSLMSLPDNFIHWNCEYVFQLDNFLSPKRVQYKLHPVWCSIKLLIAVSDKLPVENNTSLPSTISFEAISGSNGECPLPCISTTMRFSPERSYEKWGRLSHFFWTTESKPQGIPVSFTYFVNSPSVYSSMVTISPYLTVHGFVPCIFYGMWGFPHIGPSYLRVLILVPAFV